MLGMSELIGKLGDRFGILAESNTTLLKIRAMNGDGAVGDLFLLPSLRGGNDRFYVFRTTQYANVMIRELDINDLASNKLVMPDAYMSQDLEEEFILEHALSHHLGVFWRTGAGKSNLMMVLLKSVLDYNWQVEKGKSKGPKASVFAIDPHDEFRHWHRAIGGADGIGGIVDRYAAEEREALVEPKDVALPVQVPEFDQLVADE